MSSQTQGEAASRRHPNPRAVGESPAEVRGAEPSLPWKVLEPAPLSSCREEGTKRRGRDGEGRSALWTRTRREQRKFICQDHEIKGGFPLVHVIANTMVFVYETKQRRDGRLELCGAADSQGDQTVEPGEREGKVGRSPGVPPILQGFLLEGSKFSTKGSNPVDPGPARADS